MTRRPLPAVVPATWLRVYEPIVVFPPEQRRRWTVRAAGDDDEAALDRPEHLERALAWRRLLASAAPVSPVADAFGTARPAASRTAPGEPPAARLLERDGRLLACPVPPGDRGLVRAWRLPLAWLALVRSPDRVPGGPGRYLAPMSTCRDRSAAALRTVLGALGEGGLADRLAETGQWLEGFDPRSWVELDARCVVALVDGDGVDDVRMGLESLEDGDPTGAAAAYRRISRRDRTLVELSQSS